MPHALELSLRPEGLEALFRLPFLERTGRPARVETVWSDTVTGTLAARAEALSETSGRWRLERLRPSPDVAWPPMTPAPLLSEGDSPDDCRAGPPAELGAIASFRGQRRTLATQAATNQTEDAVVLTVLDGHLRGVPADRPVCRITLTGAAPALRETAMRLAQAVPVTVPRAALAAEAIAAARGQEPAPRHLGTPVLQPDQALTDSIAQVIGQLLDAMLHWTEQAAAGATTVPVHQMRVATRRLRSALSIFKSVTSGPEMDLLSAALRETATRLGGARDWDVFLEGVGAQVKEAFPEDRRVQGLLSAARRKRAEAYAELRAHLASTAFHELEVALGCAAALRPWEASGDDALRQDTAAFAAAVLARRLRKVRRAGRGLATLPVEALHELRKDCKRLRYAAEFFQPLFPDKGTRRFLKHLAALQEELGALNDGAVAANLMSHLGRAERGYAAGLVTGFVTGRASDTRASIGRAWKRFKRQDPFWA